MVRCDFCDGDNYIINDEGKKVEAEGHNHLLFIPCSCTEGFNKGQCSDPALEGEGFDLDDRYDDPWSDESNIDVWSTALGDKEEDSEDPYRF